MKSKTPVVWILLLALVCGSVWGQTFVAVNHGTLPRTSSDLVWMGDYDADGYPDLLALDSTTVWQPKLYRNLAGFAGNWFGPAALPDSMERRGYFRACWRDANGDGFLDILGAANDDFGRVVTRVYLQSAADHSFAGAGPDLPGTPIAWADLDNDGRLDIVARGDREDATIYWLEADGSYTAGQKLDAQSVQAADLDRDGDLDLVLQYGASVALRNDGRRVFTNLGAVGALGSLADLNGDGRLDIYGWRWLEASRAESYVSLNQNAFQFASNSVVIGGKRISAVADFSSDDLPDFLLAGPDSVTTAAIWINTNNTFAASPYTFSANALISGAQIADVDRDGDPDLVATMHDLSHRFYQNRMFERPMPDAPLNLNARVTRDRVFFSWAAGSTRPATFNLRVGTRPGGNDLVDGASQGDGRRLLSQMGNTQTSTRWYLDGLKPGVYYWSAQAVDWAFRGSAFAPEMSFTVTGNEAPEPAPTISVATTNLVTFEDTQMELTVTFGPLELIEGLTVELVGVNTNLAKVAMTGSGAVRTLSIQPVTNQFGATTFAAQALSANGEVKRLVFGLTILPVNDLPVLSTIADQIGYAGHPPLVAPFSASDVEWSADTNRIFSLTAQSSDERVLASSAIAVTRVGVTLDLSSARPGAITVTITADDGEAKVSTSFALLILARPFVRDSSWPGMLSDAAWADMNNDGWMDLVTPAAVYFNQRGSVSEVRSIQTNFMGKVAVGDFNGDNWVDVLVISPTGVLNLRNQKGTNLVSMPEGRIGWIAPRQIEVGDVDNDGDMDLVVTGEIVAGLRDFRTWLYVNDGGTFTVKNIGLPSFEGWFTLADTDRDGWLDFVFGGTISNQRRSGYLRSIGRNSFIGQPTSGLYRYTGVADVNSDGVWDFYGEDFGAILIYTDGGTEFAWGMDASGPLVAPPVWADFENDGRLDLLGRFDSRDASTGWYRNQGNFQLQALGDPLRINLDYVEFLSAGDGNNDGALDLATTKGVWVNTTSAPNPPPGAPRNLRATKGELSMTFSWDAATDLNQPAGLTYNVRVGTRPGASDVLSACALPSGKRLLAAGGNAGTLLSLMLTNLTEESYFWSVQAIDNSFAGGPFAAEKPEIFEGPDNQAPIVVATPGLFFGPEDVEGSIQLQISDDRTPGDLVTLQISNSNPDLIAITNLFVVGTGAQRTLRFKPQPNATGNALIMIMPTDARGAFSRTFVDITITPVDDPPTISTIGPQLIESVDDPVTAAFTVSDVDDSPGGLRLAGTSGNTDLIPNTNISFGGDGMNRTITLRAGSTNLGVVPVTIAVVDAAGATTEMTFPVTLTNRVFKQVDFDFGTASPFALAWADLNSDGRMDIALSQFKTIFYTNAGPSGFGRTPLELAPVTSIAWGDYDSDNDPDLLLHGESLGGLFEGLYNNNGAGELTLVTPSLARMSGLARFGDLDNDGDLDIVFTGSPGALVLRADMYRNEGGAFTLIGNRIQGVNGFEPMLEDFTGDGWMDLHVARIVNDTWRDGVFIQENGFFPAKATPWGGRLLAWSDFTNDGAPDAIVETTNYVIQLYRNVNGKLTPTAQAIAENIGAVTASTADIDSDGFNDLVIGTALAGRVFMNQRDGTFREVSTPLLNLRVKETHWADYNNDGKIDLMLSPQSYFGEAIPGKILYRNTMLTTNTPPGAPTNVRAHNTADGLLIQWDHSIDANQSGGLTYNLAIGTAPGKWDVMSPMSAVNGWRKIPAKGNVGWHNWKIITGLEIGKQYYFTAQAVDNSFAGSAFAEEQSIVLETPPRVEISAFGNIVVTGEIGRVYRLETSPDMREWTEARTWTASSEQTELFFALDRGGQFIRVTGQ